MPTVFIAVQCFHCSTMQVKQKKKSSNKWSCVVCNEKQSVRNVFAQGFMAKYVRKFVQSFNMSRQVAEQRQQQEEETLVPQSNEDENQKKKKRNDWSEYIDHDYNTVEIGEDQGTGEVYELNVVTELPKVLFKKPKLRGNYSAAGLDCEDGEKLRRPVFGKRKAKKMSDINADKATRTSTETVVKDNLKQGDTQNQLNCNYAEKGIGGASKWREYYKTQDDDNVEPNSKLTKVKGQMSKWNDCMDHSFTNMGLSSVITKLKKPASKWKDFIDDADEPQLEIGFHFREPNQEINHDMFETTVSDEIVEDDIHPDFW